MKKKTYNYFAYGSNLNTARMFDRCSEAQIGCRATLPNYRLVFQRNLKNNAVANIIPCEGAEVVGAIYKVTAEDISELDRYEGNPAVYHREWVDVTLKSGKVVKAITYVMTNKAAAFGNPTKEYFTHISKGYKQWGLPKIKLLNALEGAIKIKNGLEKVFVYGSLLSGFGNHAYLENARCLGAGQIIEKFQMYSLGAFPALVSAEQSHVIIGEVYEVSPDEMQSLDRLEGYNPQNPSSSFYDRKKVTVILDSGEDVEAWVYFMPQGVRTGSTLVESGDWRAFKGKQFAVVYADAEIEEQEF